MGRKTWVKPMTLVQKFEANEPVAAIGQCYNVLCKSDAAYKYQAWPPKAYISDSGAPEYHWSHPEGYYDSAAIEGSPLTSFKHENCKKDNNVFNADLTDPANPQIQYILETGGSANEGNFEYWLDYNGSGVFDSGDIIYWTNTTGGSVGTRWNHWGEVASADSSRPLHS